MSSVFISRILWGFWFRTLCHHSPRWFLMPAIPHWSWKMTLSGALMSLAALIGKFMCMCVRVYVRAHTCNNICVACKSWLSHSDCFCRLLSVWLVFGWPSDFPYFIILHITLELQLKDICNYMWAKVHLQVMLILLFWLPWWQGGQNLNSFFFYQNHWQILYILEYLDDIMLVYLLIKKKEWAYICGIFVSFDTFIYDLEYLPSDPDLWPQVSSVLLTKCLKLREPIAVSFT